MNEKQSDDSQFDMSEEWAAAIPDNAQPVHEELTPKEEIGRLEYRFQAMSDLIEDAFEDSLRVRFSHLEIKNRNMFGLITDPEKIRKNQEDFQIVSEAVAKLDSFKARMTGYRKTIIHQPEEQRVSQLRTLVTELHKFLRTTSLYLGI